MIRSWMHKWNSLLELIPAVGRPICITLAMFLAVAQSVVNIAGKWSLTNSHNIHISPGRISSLLVWRPAARICFSSPIFPCVRRRINLLSVSVPLWYWARWCEKQGYVLFTTTLGGLPKSWLVTELLLGHLWKEALFCIRVAILATSFFHQQKEFVQKWTVSHNPKVTLYLYPDCNDTQRWVYVLNLKY